MREYSKVSPVFWTGETGRFLRRSGSEAQIVCLYLITGPTANMIGLYELPLPLLAHHTGLTLEGASKGLRRGFEGGFCKYHEPSEMVWVPEMARYQIGESVSVADNRHKAIIKELFLVSKSVFLPEFLQKYGEAYSISPSIFEGSLKVLARGFEGASKGLRSQEQEQEHLQEQEITTPPNPPSGGTPADAGGVVNQPPSVVIAPPPATDQVKPKRRQKPLHNPEAANLPHGPDFRSAWLEWCNYRRDEKREPVTALAGEKQLLELAKITEQEAIKAINESIKCQWKGIFPESSDAPTARNRTQFQTPGQRQDSYFAEMAADAFELPHPAGEQR